MSFLLLLLAAGASTQELDPAREAALFANLQARHAKCAAYADPHPALFSRLGNSCIESCELAAKEPRPVNIRSEAFRSCHRNSTSIELYQVGSLFKEGAHYTRITVPMQTMAPPGYTEIVMLSSLACGHCMSARDELANWVKDRPKYSVRFVPLTWGYDQKRDLDYDAYALVDLFCGEVPDKALAARVRNFSAALPRDKRLRSPADVPQLLKAAGVDAESLRILDVFALKASMRQAQQITLQSGAKEAPAYVVNGKYLVASGFAFASQL